MKISVICVYNREEQLDTQLKASLEKQDVAYEFIGIDNTMGEFTSAAAALNYGARHSTGDILVFSHQDIFFKTDHELADFAKAIEENKNGTIIGAIGVKEPSKVYYGNYSEGNEYDEGLTDTFAKKYYSVSCVDECIFGMKRTTWENHPFDEVICNNWHLYAVEACLWARKTGHSVYVYPIQIHHFSGGQISLGYMRNLKKLCGIYRNDFKYIWTTCYKVKTNPLYINMLFYLWTFNRLLRRNL